MDGCIRIANAFGGQFCHLHRPQDRLPLVEHDGPLTTPCLVMASWNGSQNYSGWRYKGGMIPGHRFVWMMEYGPIPKGMVVCHRCDFPPCCNIEHLWLGTQGENLADCVAKGRKFQRWKS